MALEEALPYFIRLGPAHTLAYADLVELALRLELLRERAGMGKIRKFLKGIPRPDQFGHILVQLEIGSLASMRGFKVALESEGDPSVGPVDLVVRSSTTSLPMEVAVLLPAEDFRRADRATDRIFEAIRALEAGYDVSCHGRLGNPLDGGQEEALLAGLETAARLVHDEGSSRRIDLPEGFLVVSPGWGESTEGITAPFPVMDSRRLTALLEKKAIKSSGQDGVWLRVDARDGLWQFTPWSQLDLEEKLSTLWQLVGHTLSQYPHVGGVVVTPGCVHAQGVFDDESTETEGSSFAIRRLVAPLRVRETLIMTLRTDQELQARLWQDLYENEPQWLDWALAQRGLRSVHETFG